MNLIKRQQTVRYLIWLWSHQLIDILCLIFLNINNIQHQQLKLFVQKKKKKKKKRWKLNLIFFSFLKIKKAELSQ